MHRMMPCGEGCVFSCLCCSLFPFCGCYFKDEQDGQWKECVEDKGGKKIMYMADEKTIKMKTSTAAKDHVWGESGAQAATGKDVMTLRKLC